MELPPGIRTGGRVRCVTEQNPEKRLLTLSIVVVSIPVVSRVINGFSLPIHGYRFRIYDISTAAMKTADDVSSPPNSPGTGCRKTRSESYKNY